MGAIIYWGLVRFAILMVAMWLLYSYVPNYSEWWTLFFIAVGVIVIYPAQIAFRKHQEATSRANQNPLCATCRNFVPREALCGALDEHVKKHYTPCEGQAWEPIATE